MQGNVTITLGATPTQATTSTSHYAIRRVSYSNNGDDIHYVGLATLDDTNPESNALTMVLPGETKDLPLVGWKVIPGSVPISQYYVKGPADEEGTFDWE